MKSNVNLKAWIWLAFLLALFLILSYILGSHKPQEYPPYDSESPAPTGTKAVYTYLENEQGSVKRWSHSPAYLSLESKDQVLIMVEPFAISSEEDMNAYKKFMEAGNTILLFKENPKDMFSIKTKYPEAEQDKEKIKDAEGHTYQGDLLSDVRLVPNERDDILLQDELGVLALKRKVGEGDLIVSNSPNWLMNERILTRDHLHLVLSLLEEGMTSEKKILFDEYHHGGEGGAPVHTLYPKWFLLIILQCVIFTLLWLWYRGKRFGSILVPREETVRFSDERIKALGAWYLKGRQYRDSINIQSDYVRGLLQEKWGIPTTRDWVDLEEQLARKIMGIPRKEIPGLLKGLHEIIDKESLSKQEYLLWSKKINRIRKEVEER
ncbi:DUF4350 domain-containing protein [Rossellomorea aquimaris]|uniref:DUF4350 domain-containing protein n=1 Tax=Rossellomorea aquimaris TaxID=189382 RepID=UPI0007D04A3C|nr:DUF4350 domain-containing protein [Rossellomorea aquimaris]